MDKEKEEYIEIGKKEFLTLALVLPFAAITFMAGAFCLACTGVYGLRGITASIPFWILSGISFFIVFLLIRSFDNPLNLVEG